jgi:adhesin transport system outer membrane protein
MKSKSSDIFIFIAFAGFVSHAWGQALPSLGALPPLMAEALARHPQVRMQQALASAAGIDVDSARWQYFPTPSLSVERANTANDTSCTCRGFNDYLLWRYCN